MYLALVKCFITRNEDLFTGMEIFSDTLRQIKVLLSPITPPNYEIESAASLYMQSEGLKVPKNAIRHRNPEAPQRTQGQRNIRNKPDASAPAQKKRRHHKKKVSTDSVKQA